MFHQSSKQILLGIFVALLLITMPAYAVKKYKISNYGGVHQIWFEAEDFDERNPPTNEYYPVVDADGAFGKAINRAGGAGGRIRWTFDISAAGGKGGTWYFWGRVIIPYNESDYMLVEGDPGDAEIPTGPPFPGDRDTQPFIDGDDRIFEFNVGPPWGWTGTNTAALVLEGHVKELQDGENTMYIYHRQGIEVVFWDVFMWTDDPDYVPTDEDYINATTVLPGAASNPSPAGDETDVPRDVVLSWEPGVFVPPVNGHTVYFSESFENVNVGIGGVTQDASSYTPPQLLDFGKTYYWRVDEVNGPPDFTVYAGMVWQFTTEPFAYPIAGANISATASSQLNENQGPEKTIDGSGLDANDLHSTDETGIWLSNMAGPQPTWIQYEFDRVYKLHQMWVWNHNTPLEPVLGFGFKDVTIEYSTNGTDWAVLADVAEFARAPGAPEYAYNTTVDFGGVPAKYVRLTATSNWGGLMPQYGLSEVRFFYIPVNAREPYPDSEATGVDIDVVLGWRAGREAAKHDVYFSADEQAVIDGTAAVTTVTETSYGPLSLDLGMIYYWKINEVNMAETPTTLEGDVWNFTTRQFLVVDDFESYNDLDPTDPESNRIFNAWIDGYGIAANGSVVGYEIAPFCEQTIVHSGKQSMPLSYSNTGGAAYSEAERTFAAAQNWTQAGAATLVLYFHGAEGNTGQLYVKIDGSKVVYDGDAGDIAKVEWKQWNIELAPLGAGLQSVTKLSIGIDGNGAGGTLYFDDILLYRLAP
ncbi:hypothetical protein ES703_48602 [subsurface metagenome]